MIQFIITSSQKAIKRGGYSNKKAQNCCHYKYLPVYKGWGWGCKPQYPCPVPMPIIYIIYHMACKAFIKISDISFIYHFIPNSDNYINEPVSHVMILSYMIYICKIMVMLIFYVLLIDSLNGMTNMVFIQHIIHVYGLLSVSSQGLNPHSTVIVNLSYVNRA